LWALYFGIILAVAIFSSVIPLSYSQESVISTSDDMMQYKAPLRQIRDDGVSPQDIKCNEGKVLVFKNSDSSPLCIYFDSVIKLEKLNYLFVDYDRVLDQTIDVKCITDKNEIKTFSLQYSIENAEITSIEITNDTFLDINIDSQDYGSLYIELPRKFMNSRTVNDSGDDAFFTLLDGLEIFNLETQTTKDSRTLKINFKSDTNLITVFESLPTYKWGMKTCEM